ncbi:MAG: putative thymidylate kinase [Methanocella sp. PtaU1.Bin125]|nr:MAG: putative thymidylate kinase [Methanocella sp. PtaU1.Bin125]
MFRANEQWMSDRRPDKKGCLISIEGIDGAGKSTQIRMLGEWLRANGIDAAMLKEPTDGLYGREIRDNAAAHRPVSPQEEMRLFMMDRKEDVAKNIRPALDAGKVVVMDRYYQSNMAYQGARGLDPWQIEAENERFSPVPDLVIVLDIDPAHGLSRITNTRKTALDSFEKEDYLRKVRDIFLAIGRKPNGVIIDAERPPAAVHESIVRAIKERLPGIF